MNEWSATTPTSLTVHVGWETGNDTSTGSVAYVRPRIYVTVSSTDYVTPTVSLSDTSQLLEKLKPHLALRLFHARIWKPATRSWPREAFRARYGYQDAPRLPCYRAVRRR